MNKVDEISEELKVKQSPHLIRLNGFFHRLISIQGYPRIVKDGWLDQLNRPKIDFDWSIQIRPQPLESTIVQLNQQLVKQKSDLIASNQRGLVNPSLQIQHDDTLLLLNRLQMGQERLFDLSIYLNCRAKTKKDLDALTQKIICELNGLLMIPTISYFQMASGIQSLLPIGLNTLNDIRSIPSESMSACFPFTSRFLDENDKGLLIGLNTTNDSPVLLDFFSLPNHNGLVIGSSGSGKSFLVKLLAMRCSLTDTTIIIIDPQNEYIEISKHFGGKIINVKNIQDIGFDFFSLQKNQNTKEKISSLITFFKLLIPNHSSDFEHFIQKALVETYNQKGIKLSDFKSDKKNPKITDFLKNFRGLTVPSDKKTQLEQWSDELNFLISEIDINQTIELDFTSWTNFNLLNVSQKSKPAIMYLILEHIRSLMVNSSQKKNNYYG